MEQQQLLMTSQETFNHEQVIEKMDVDDIVILQVPGKPWAETVIEEFKITFQRIKEATKPENIKNDNTDISTMSRAAESSEWDIVHDILSRKPYIINAIPLDKAWGLLHQACSQNDTDAVTKLLTNKICDSEIKTKRDIIGLVPANSIPLGIARKQNRVSLIPLLEKHKMREEGSIITFLPAQLGAEYVDTGVPYFMLAVAFLPKDKIAKMKITEKTNFSELNKKIHSVMKNDWKYLCDAVAECLYPLDSVLLYELKSKVHDSTSLWQMLIYIYTADCIYRQVNQALRRATIDLRPTGDDFLLCLFSLLLEVTLLCEERLKRYTGVTYRGMNIPITDVEKYNIGTKFYWMSFISCIKKREYAESFAPENSTIFVFDNSQLCDWSPREIKDYTINSGDFGENELVYPAGALFEVTANEKKGKFHEVHVKLITPHN